MTVAVILLPSAVFDSTVLNFVLAGWFQHRVCHAHDSTRPERNQGNRLPGTFQGQYGSIRLICIIKNYCSLLCQVYCEGIAGCNDGSLWSSQDYRTFAHRLALVM